MLKMKKVLALFFIASLFVSFASAGIGIFVKQQSLMLNEGEEGSLSVGVYNPYSTEGNVKVGVSEELQEVLILKEKHYKV